MIGQKLIEAAGNGISTVAVAEAIDFDGTNDYLSRSTDLTGNADGKTFTFSAWVWMDPTSSDNAMYSLGTTGGGYIRFNTSTRILSINLQNTAGSALVLNATGPTSAACPFYTWTNLLISVDLANTANRSVYFDDQLVTVTWTTYTNAAINWTQTPHYIASQYGSAKSKARLSNVFLDYTYRDLSVEANRRLFITADLKPAAGQAALNPILYLPMDDPTAPGANAGTGGNFTLTGTVARSGRGPNQYNAPYSTFDGASDYLRKTTVPTGVADSTSFTFSCCVNLSAVLTSQADILRITNNFGSTIFRITINGAMKLSLYGESSTGNLLLQATGATTLTQGRNYQVTISIRLSSTSERFVYINGVQETMTWSNYSSGSIDFNPTSLGAYTICGSSGTGSNFLPALVGAVWFSPGVYRDLLVEENLAKFVIGTGINAAPADLGVNGELPTGTSPRIYLPMYGNKAGKNYGTGGDFTAFSDPYTGARGPNEFWGNKANFAASGGALEKNTGLTGLGGTKTLSGSFWINNVSNPGTAYIYQLLSSAGNAYLDGSNRIVITGRNSSGTTILSLYANTTIPTGTSAYVQFCVDLSDTGKRFIYINGVSSSLSVSTYTNNTLKTATGAFIATYGDYAIMLSELYLTNQYIDFSSEANRLKFRDCFGNPTDLPSAITALSIPNPAIYMRFPPTAFGTNSGTGGNFTVNGTITDGGQL